MSIETFFELPENEKPLDKAVTDGGFCGILRTVGCIGDSLSSGEYEVKDGEKTHYIDLFDFSWGQFFARLSGNMVRNFSRGGMSAKEYCRSFADKNCFWDKSMACNAYIVALGVNDINAMIRGEIEFGSVEDIDFEDWHNNKPTFCGYYGTILQRYREISPRCRLFLMTLPKDSNREEFVALADKHREFLMQLAEKLDFTYLLDFRTYAPVYDEKFHSVFYMNGHLNPMGYLLTGRMVASYIDYIIRHNPQDFQQIGLLRQSVHDINYPW